MKKTILAVSLASIISTSALAVETRITHAIKVETNNQHELIQTINNNTNANTASVAIMDRRINAVESKSSSAIESMRQDVLMNQFSTQEVADKASENGMEIDAMQRDFAHGIVQNLNDIDNINGRLDNHRDGVNTLSELVADNVNRADTHETAINTVSELVADNVNRADTHETAINTVSELVADNANNIEASTKYVLAEQKASTDIINAQNDLQQEQLNNHDARIANTEEAVFGKVEDIRGYVDSVEAKTESLSSATASNTAKTEQNKKVIAVQSELIGMNIAQTRTNTASISRNEAGISANAQGIAENKAEIKDLRKDFERQSKEMSGAIAGVAAMSNIPTAMGIGKFAIGAGVGYYNSESALAVGASYRATNSVSAKFSVSAQSGNFDPVIGAGVSYEF